MKRFKYLLILLPFSLNFALAQDVDTIENKHLINIKQLTFGGDNAEAYFSFDNNKLAFQSNNKAWGVECDQIFLLDLNNWKSDSKPPLISTGKGRTTCSYFMPGNKTILYASTHLRGDKCPETGDLRRGGKYLWPIFNTYDIFVADLNGKIVKQLTNAPGYDAEATVSPDGKKIVFTSDRTGDLELIQEYKQLLSEGLVAPTNMEIYTCNVDGSNLKQITHLGRANWAPFFHPSGKKILFSSNHESKSGFNFQLYMINTDGTGLVQITDQSVFNAFPMFSPDGKKLIFSSNRNNGGTHDTNLFIADWKD